MTCTSCIPAVGSPAPAPAIDLLDVEAWVDLCTNMDYISFTKSISAMDILLRLACQGAHCEFAKVLASVEHDDKSARISFMVFVMLDDAKGAALVASDVQSPTYAMCIRYALRNDKTRFLEWALATSYVSTTLDCRNFISDAGRAGTAGVLDVLLKSGFTITTTLMWSAIEGDNLQAIKWYLEGAHSNADMMCGYAIRNALSHGKLTTLSYLLKRQGQINAADLVYACKSNAATLDKLMAMNGVIMPPLDDPMMCINAVSSSNLETLIWCKGKGYRWNTDTFREAFRYPADTSTEILNYLWDNNCPKPKPIEFKIYMVLNPLSKHAQWYVEHLQCIEVS